MLQVKSFKINDDGGINELLSKYRLAAGASILVTDGNICVPYEDGEQETTLQKKIELLELKYKIEREINVITHSQKVLINKINGINVQLNTLIASEKEIDTNKPKDNYNEVKGIKDEKKRLGNVLKQFELNIIQNQAELTNKNEDIKVYNEEIKVLEVK